jgi:hypothetical protein
MAKITKSAIGKPVEVVFLDHAMNMAAIECVAYGRLVAMNDTQLIVRAWHCQGMHDTDSNHEQFAILRVAIKRFRVLR